MSEQLAKAEKKINEEIKNHIITSSNLTNAKKKLVEQELKIAAQQVQLGEQELKIAAQQVQIGEQHRELIIQKEKFQDLLTKVNKLEESNCSYNNILKTFTIVIVGIAVTTIVNKYIK
jgi:hypothetical protein